MKVISLSAFPEIHCSCSFGKPFQTVQSFMHTMHVVLRKVKVPLL